MSIININIGSAQATHVLPEGEHRVSIVSAYAGQSKSSGRGQITVTFEPTDDPYADVIRDYLPTDQADDKRQENRRILRWAAFAEAFSLDVGEIEVGDDGSIEAWVGQTGYVTVSVEDSPGYGEQNRIRSYVASH